MKQRAIDILCDPGLVDVREEHLARLTELFAGETPERPFFLCGIVGESRSDTSREPERCLGETLDSLAAQAERARDRVVFRPLCLHYDPYGVHFIDRILGANVYARDGQIWSDPLPTPIGELELPDIEADETWALLRRFAEAFVATGVTAPMLGLPTISSALNVAVNLHGEDVLVKMRTEPAKVSRDLAVINDLLCNLHRWYLTHVPLAQLQPVVPAGRCQPPGYGQLCGCTSQLLSADTYRDLVAPLDEALLSTYPKGGMIHLCGSHTQHIAVWREMQSLRAIQINDRAAEDFEVYFKALRDDQVIYLNATSSMTMERALRVSRGRRTVLVGEPPLTP